MQEQKFVKVFRTAKIIQLCILLGIELTFFLILTYNVELSRQIYTNQALFTLCLTTWILMVFNLLCLLYDFLKLRSFASESHALTQAAYLDSLTGIPNRNSLDVIAGNYNTAESLAHTGCAMITIDNLKEMNDLQGHTVGDTMIRDFSLLLEEVGDSYGFIGRNGGNQFVAILENCTDNSMDTFLRALDRRVTLYNREHTQAPLKLRSSCTICEQEPVENFTALLTTTYHKLYHTS